ncbi:hypothetical protein B0H16DRAFT_1587071, partial [Mycena metata]
SIYLSTPSLRRRHRTQALPTLCILLSFLLSLIASVSYTRPGHPPTLPTLYSSHSAPANPFPLTHTIRIRIRIRTLPPIDRPTEIS